MELPKLVVELVGDYSKLLEDIQEARIRAIQEAKRLEKNLNLDFKVNDNKLTELNRHLDIKVRHLQQTQRFFDANPLTVRVNDKKLDDLNKKLDKLGSRKNGVIEIKITQSSSGQGSSNFLQNIASAPFKLAGNIISSPFKLFGKAVNNIAVGFTEDIGRQISRQTTAGAVRTSITKIKKGLQTIDEEIIGKADVYETFLAEILRSGQIGKAFNAAARRAKISKQLQRLNELQFLANEANSKEEKRKTVDNLIKNNPSIKKEYESFKQNFRVKNASEEKVKDEFVSRILEIGQPTDISQKIVLPLIKEFQPLLRFLQGMQAYNTSVLSEKIYNERKASFPILKSGETVVSVFGGAENKKGQGGRAIATSLEPMFPGVRFMPVENKDTDATERTQEVDKFIKSILARFAPQALGSADTITNAARQIAFSLNPLGSSVGAAQALAYTKLAQEQGQDAAALSFSLGGADAYRYSRAAQYQGINTNTLAMAYPFLNLAGAPPQNFQANIIDKDPLTFPFQLGAYNPTEQSKILTDTGIKVPSASVHGVHHLFKSQDFLENIASVVGSVPVGDPNKFPATQQLGMELQGMLGSAKATEAMLGVGSFDLDDLEKLASSKNILSKYKKSGTEEAKVIAIQLEKYIENILSQAINFIKSNNIDLPDDISQLQAFSRYISEITKINNVLTSFKTGTPLSNDDAFFAGELDPATVSERKRILDLETLPWFKKQSQFGEYGQGIIKAFEQISKIQEEFIKTGGNLSQETIDSISLYELPKGSERLTSLAKKTNEVFPENQFYDENLRLQSLDAPEEFKKYPGAILAFNQMIESLGNVMPDASAIQKIAFGMSGASALLSENLVYKTDISPEGASKIASQQEVEAYKRLQGRLSPLLYQAIPGQALVTERIKGVSLKDRLEELASPIKNLQSQLSQESDSGKQEELRVKIRQAKETFNNEAEKLYYQLGQLGAAMHEMGVAHNDLASGNVFFDEIGNITSIDLGNAKVDPSLLDKIQDQVTAIQRALIDQSFMGILDPLRTSKAIAGGFQNPLSIPQSRKINPNLLNPLTPGTKIPIGSNKQSMLKEALLQQQMNDNVAEAVIKAQEISQKFNENFAKLKTLLAQAKETGDFSEATNLAKVIQELGDKAKEEIKFIRDLANVDPNIAKGGGSAQIGQAIGQVSTVQAKVARLIKTNKLPINQAVQSGQDTALGFAKGIEQSLNAIKTISEEMANIVPEIIANELDIQSPSKVMEQLGKWTAKGFSNGLDFLESQNLPDVFKNFISEIKDSVDSFISGATSVQEFTDKLKNLSGVTKLALGVAAGFAIFQLFGQQIAQFNDQSIQIATNFENLERRIRFVSGGFAEGAKNIAFLRSEAKRLNVDLTQTLTSGAGFLQATKGTALEGDPSRQVISAITQASAVYGLDIQQQERTFTALEQIAAKTVVSQEELRQQLAEAIPNAAQIAANAYGTTTQAMNQLLESGRALSDDFLVKFSQQLLAETSSGVAAATNSSLATLNKFNNSLTELQESFGKLALPVRNFTLNLASGGLDFIVKNAGLIRGLLAYALIVITNSAWVTFKNVLGGISFNALGAAKSIGKLALGVAAFAGKILIISAVIESLGTIINIFRDNSGELGRQIDIISLKLLEYQELIAKTGKIELPKTDEQIFGEKLLNPFEATKFLDEMQDSLTKIGESYKNTEKIISNANSSEISQSINAVNKIDKQLENIRMRRRALLASDPSNSKAIRELAIEESKLNKERQDALRPSATLKGIIDNQVENLKSQLDYLKNLKESGKLYSSEMVRVNQEITRTENSLDKLLKVQDDFKSSVKDSLTEMQKLRLEINKINAEFDDNRSRIDRRLLQEQINLLNLESTGNSAPGQTRFTISLREQVALFAKINENIKQVRASLSLLNMNGLPAVLNNVGLTPDSGTNEIRRVLETTLEGSKERELLTDYLRLRELESETRQLEKQMVESRVNLERELFDANRAIVEYFTSIVRQSQEITNTAKEILNQNKVSFAKGRLRGAIANFQDDFISQFTDSLIQIIDILNQPVQEAIQAQQQLNQNQNQYLDQIRQAQEIQRSQPIGNLSNGVIAPVKGPITSGYGWRNIFGRRDFHEGIDYGVPVGTNVLAPTDGRVSRVFNDRGGGGLVVTLESINAAGQKVEQNFLHLSQSLVQVGQEIRQGQVIAKSGNTGRSTGPHLDWRIRVGGQWVNPMDFLKSATMRSNRSQSSNSAEAIAKARGLQSLLIQDLTGKTVGGFNSSSSPNSPASTIKLIIASLLVDAVKQGRIDANKELTIKSGEVAEGSRIRAGQKISVTELLTRMLRDSDNTSSNALINLLGGTKEITKLAQSSGFRNTIFKNLLSVPGSKGFGNVSNAEDVTAAMQRLLRDNSNVAQVAESAIRRTRNFKFSGEVGGKIGNNSKVIGNVGIVNINGKEYVVTAYANANGNLENSKQIIRNATNDVVKAMSRTQSTSSTSNFLSTIASTYGAGDGFHGRRTSSGEIFNKNALTTAINEDLRKRLGLKFGDKLEVINPANNKSVIVRINDHGPYERRNGKFVPHSTRGLDLSTAAAQQIGISLGKVQFRVLGRNIPQTQPQVNAQPNTSLNDAQKLAAENLNQANANVINRLVGSRALAQVEAQAAKSRSLFQLQEGRINMVRSVRQNARALEDEIAGLGQDNPEKQFKQQIVQIERTFADRIEQLNLDRQKQADTVAKTVSLLNVLKQSQDSDFPAGFDRLGAIQSLEKVLPEAQKVLNEIDAQIDDSAQVRIRMIEDITNKYNLAETVRLNDARNALVRGGAELFRQQAQAAAFFSERSLGNFSYGDPLKLNAQSDLMSAEIAYREAMQELNKAALETTNKNILSIINARKQQALITLLRSSRSIENTLRRETIDRALNIKEERLGVAETINRSRTNILDARSSGVGLFGLSSKEFEKQKALADLNIEIAKERLEIEKLANSGKYSAEQIEELNKNLTILSDIKLENISNEFNMFADVIQGVKGDTENIFKDFIMNTKSFGESIRSVIDSILNNLATMASKMLSDQLFGWIFGNKMAGKTPSFNPLGMLGNLASGLFGVPSVDAGSIVDMVAGSEFYDFVPSFSKGGMIGEIAKGMQKERLMSGGFNPRLIIANDGERILTPEEAKIWNTLTSKNKLSGFSEGGQVGSAGSSNINTMRGGDSINIAVPVTVNGESNINIDTPRLKRVLEAKIQETIKNERRPGGSLNRGGLYDR